jgi:hypothetical protein
MVCVREAFLSRIHTVTESSWTISADIVGGMEYKGSRANSTGEVNVNILLSTLSIHSADSLQDRNETNHQLIELISYAIAYTVSYKISYTILYKICRKYVFKCFVASYTISYVISYTILYTICFFTCRVWWFLRPAMMDCNSGYRSPSSHGRESLAADLASMRSCESKASSISLCSAAYRSAHNWLQYWRWPSLTWWRGIVRNTSFLLIQRVIFLTKSMEQCSGPWVLKFSDQPKRISSRTLCRMLREKWTSRTPTLQSIFVAKAPAGSSYTKLPWLHMPFQHGHDSLHWIINKRFAM